MTETEWQAIESGIREIAYEIARQTVNDIIKSEKCTPGKERTPETARLQQERIDCIRNGLEQYRESRPDSSVRKIIDLLLHQHASLVNPNDIYYRTRHNILILKYIISQPMSDKEIRKRLGMGIYNKAGFNHQLEQGIREIAALFFSDWDLLDL